MKIMIAGLGLIGGSMAKSLVRAGYSVGGYDLPQVLRRAEEEGAVSEHLRAEDCDVVFVALPPDAAMAYIGGTAFKEGAIVADICGVKEALEQFVYARPRSFRYVGCHPMAGKEVSGFENSSETLFDGASMIVVENEHTDAAAIETLERLFSEMGFGLVKHCSAAYHDAKIAYTSQLAHIVSNAYVKSPTADGFPGFTGGSFQDMTRIAGVDEQVWTRLYMLNRGAVTEELRRLIRHLNEYLAALEGGDESALRELLKQGRLRKAQLDEERKIL